MKKIGKYIFPIFFVFLSFPQISKGQKNIAGAGLHEIGVGIGALNYSGDLSPGFNFSFYRPGGMVFYRFNVSPVVSLRASMMFGAIHANESKIQDPVHQSRNLSFSAPISEFAAAAEYNFFNYRIKKEEYRYSPYLTGGLAVYNSTYTGGYQVAIPLGAGIKYRLNKRINLGMEFVARKTFTDDLDGISSYFNPIHQTSNPHNTDWYYYTGFSISWTSYSVICPKPFQQ
jgi:hypothetical protein